MSTSDNDRLKLRNRIVTEGRAEINKSIKNGDYLEWLKQEYGVIDMDSILLDREFLDDMKREIEKSREKRIVYDKDYQKIDLEEWKRKNERKLTLRGIFKKSEKENQENGDS